MRSGERKPIDYDAILSSPVIQPSPVQPGCENPRRLKLSSQKKTTHVVVREPTVTASLTVQFLAQAFGQLLDVFAFLKCADGNGAGGRVVQSLLKLGGQLQQTIGIAAN